MSLSLKSLEETKMTSSASPNQPEANHEQESEPPKPQVAKAANYRHPQTPPTYQSDIPEGNAGILHVTRPARSEQRFAWIKNAQMLNNALDHFERLLFERKNCRFIPYSSLENWVANYAHAPPSIIFDECGKIQQSEMRKKDPKKDSVAKMPPPAQKFISPMPVSVPVMPRPVRARDNVPRWKPLPYRRKTYVDTATQTDDFPPIVEAAEENDVPKLCDAAALTHAERDELHILIYNYFLWLRKELGVLQQTDKGKRKISRLGANTDAVDNILEHMKSVSRLIQQIVDTDGVENTQLKRKPKENNDDNDDSQRMQQQEDSQSQNDNPQSLPLLETTFKHYCGKMVEKYPRNRARSRHHTYDDMYKMLSEYREENNGDPNVSMRHKNKTLRNWVCSLRAKKRALRKKGLEYEARQTNSLNNLTRERVEKLEELGFKWSTQQEGFQPDFDKMLGLLMEYKAVKGHVNVPREDPENRVLGRWVCNQRDTMRKLKKRFERGDIDGVYSDYLTRERIERLDEVGFEWDRSNPNTNVPWETRFEELKHFFKENGPDGQVPVNTPLYNWMKMQRRHYKEKRPDFMETKAPLLESLEPIGFKFSVVKYNDFDSHFAALKEYKRTYGDVNVPYRWKEDPQLGRWVVVCRQMKRCLREKGLEWGPGVCDSDDSVDGKPTLTGCNDMYRRGKSYLTEERVHLLDSLGFCWAKPNAKKPT